MFPSDRHCLWLESHVIDGKRHWATVVDDDMLHSSSWCSPCKHAMLEAYTLVVSERSEQADIPLPEDGRAGPAGLPLTVGDLLGKPAFWFPSELTKASLSLFTSTWQCTGITAG